MKPLIILFLSFFLISCGKSDHKDYYYDNDADNETQSSELKSWNISNFPLIINVPYELASFGDTIQRAADKWSEALGFEVFRIYYGIPNYQFQTVREPLQDDFFGIFRQEDWEIKNSLGEEIESSILAITTLSSLNQTLVHADIIFNFENHHFGDVDDPDVGFEFFTIDFESVLIHEMGHYLGLKHVATSEDPASVMKASLSRGEKRRELSEQDSERLRRLYIKF